MYESEYLLCGQKHKALFFSRKEAEEAVKWVDANEVVNWLDYNVDDVYDYDGRYISSTLKNKFKEDFKL